VPSYLGEPDSFSERLEAALAEATHGVSKTRLEAQAARDEAWARCEQLARTPSKEHRPGSAATPARARGATGLILTTTACACTRRTKPGCSR
jgi:hypothetical protein